MKTIQNVKKTGENITLDDTHFVNCQFTNCTLSYSGADYALTNTTFNNCPFSFVGPAHRTFTLLGMMGAIKPPVPPPAPPTEPPKPSGSVN